MLQLLFGWENCHLHDFQFGDTSYADLDVMDGFGHEDEMVSLAEALGARKSFLYRYDFGDSWEVHAKVLKRIQGDTEAPECLDGAMAGPPEDCGGIPGFDRLKEVLENPEADEEDLWMLDLAPKGYSPAAFSLEAVNKKLQRAFGRKRRGPKAPSETLLAGYRLAKLNLIGAIVAALKERSPLTLEQVENRLSELGFPLPAGRQSLRRSLAKSEAVRVRQDGALELVPGEALRHLVFWMDYRCQEGLPKPAPALVEPEPVTGPVSWAEIQEGYLVPWETELREQDREVFERFKRDERATLDAAHAARLNSFIKSVRGEEVESSPVRREEWTDEEFQTVNAVGSNVTSVDGPPALAVKGTYARTSIERVGNSGADMARETPTSVPLDIVKRLTDLAAAADAAEAKATLAKGREKTKLLRQAVAARTKAEGAAEELCNAQKAAKARLLEAE
jgi:hypothetical protein